jgi:hypothetical protein
VIELIAGRETAAFEVGHGGDLGELTPVSAPADNQSNRTEIGSKSALSPYFLGASAIMRNS